MRSTKRVLQGLAFVTAIVVLIGLAIGQYAGAFSSGVPVTLNIARVGTQMQERADVKVRGLIVGEVDQVTTDGETTSIRMSMNPDMIDLIPENVEAQLLPKTLFGEKFVSLVPPVAPSTARLAAGATVPEDRSRAAIEVERVLDELLPLLETVRPQDLATTLGSLSQALQGRGDQLGETLVALNTLTEGLNPAVPDLQEDIRQLAVFADNLDAAAPDLLDAVDDLAVTSATIVEKREGLRELYRSVTGASDDLRAFLDANGENLIGVASASRPTLETLARYSPEFPCLTRQLVDLVPKINDAIRPGTDRVGVNITLEIVANKGKYLPSQDEPEFSDDRGPRCYPIPTPDGTQYPPDGPFRDGSVPGPPPAGQPMGNPEEFGVETFGTYDGTTSFDLVQDQSAENAAGLLPPLTGALGQLGIEPASHEGSVDMGVANSAGEQEVVAQLLAAQQGGSPQAVPAWSSTMVGPLLRGAEVTLT
ncbi:MULTISPECIES: MCE family protein [Pseudonocardia]|uniref:Mce related protein n=1 Tax=Pseudonocardia autotrophica TaxID=2074 RepID=A0A1Y2N1I0_PSEAH|nr:MULTISPECIES: MCE family protein [Pseudonocardia]OSY40957.1 mce related protein [Pseudonocardia autotrophica]TDN73913.1 virulence factor Mce-like protein [Pseudonocardia autotrophica]